MKNLRPELTDALLETLDPLCDATKRLTLYEREAVETAIKIMKRLTLERAELLAACAALVAARDGLVSGMADRTDHAAELARAALAKAGGN